MNGGTVLYRVERIVLRAGERIRLELGGVFFLSFFATDNVAQFVIPVIQMRLHRNGDFFHVSAGTDIDLPDSIDYGELVRDAGGPGTVGIGIFLSMDPRLRMVARAQNGVPGNVFPMPEIE